MGSLPFFKISDSRFGKGLFAIKHIAANTVICTATGPSLTFQQTTELKERESHCLQVDQDKYILCDAPFLYSNHSCKPNCALDAQLRLYALHDIEQAEELVWDYSTSMLERHWTMQCACGADNCRKLITDFDLLPENVQITYLQQRIVLPFIVNHMQAFLNVRKRRA